jgi:catechol 2,3-dioxygenase-like lactoylglutathione lyase family enzyme
MERAIPILPADDLASAKAFYVDKLGFHVTFEETNGATGIMGLARGTIELTIDSPMAGHGRDACVSIRVDHADTYYDEWRHKVEIAHAPRDEYWGARTFSVHDPSGNTIFVIGPQASRGTTIYFAGSIRGGRDDRELYAAIIEMLRDYGKVVTELVGHADVNLGGENAPDREIHDRDLGWLRGSDVLVAEVTAPSLGVGYEIGRAVEWGKRIICLHRPTDDRKLSGMIAGSPGVEMHQYSAVPELRALFDRVLKP